jgi:hypothetical protein
MSAEDIGASGDRVVGFVDCVSAQDDRIATDPGLGVDYGVAADDSGVVVDVTGYVEAPEENEGATGEIALYLDGTEDADSVMHLLTGGDEDVLSEVDTVAARLGMGSRCEEKRESENPSCAGKQGSPSLTKEMSPTVVRRTGDSGSGSSMKFFE